MKRTDEELAAIVHAWNTVKQAEMGEPLSRPWARETPELRARTIRGVQRARLSGRMGMDAEKAAVHHHEEWVTEMRNAGYAPGPRKDHKRKTHPYLVHWAELSPAQQDKDRDFIATVWALDTAPEGM